MADVYAEKLAAARRARAARQVSPSSERGAWADPDAPATVTCRPLPSRWPARRAGEDLDTWAGRALASYAPEWEAQQADIERVEAERQAHLAEEYRRELRAERLMRMH